MNEAGRLDVDIDESKVTLGIRSASTTLAETSVGLNADERWSAIYYGSNGSLGLLAYQEDERDPDDDSDFRLRVFNGSDTATLDIYLTEADAQLSAVAPAVSAAPQNKLTGFDDIVAGTWRLRITTGGNLAELRLDAMVTMSRTRVGTLVVFPSTSGMLVNAALLVEGSSTVMLPNAKARLRFINALSSLAEVTPTIDGVASAATLPARSATTYVEASTGERRLGVLINGASFEAAATLAAATDVSCAVYGADGAPKVLVIADDNRAPTNAGQARIRLVNLAEGGGVLALSINLGSAVLAVPPGGISDSLQLSSIDDADIAILDASGLAVALLPQQDLLAGGAYTVFAMTDGVTVAALLRRDR